MDVLQTRHLCAVLFSPRESLYESCAKPYVVKILNRRNRAEHIPLTHLLWSHQTVHWLLLLLGENTDGNAVVWMGFRGIFKADATAVCVRGEGGV